MELQGSEKNEAVNNQLESQSQESIFTDLVDDGQYDKNLRNARIWLYVVAGIQLLVGVFEYFSMPDPSIGWIAFGIDAFIGVTFFLLALWSRKKPVTAFLSALIFYIVVLAIIMCLDPSSVFKGILIKILFIIALIKAYRDAKENEEYRKAARLDV